MEDELYLENIDEFVTDQNRVVTYKWLSYTLGVHVNQAKQMLYDYVERKRKENAGAQLHVTYLVAGNLIQNDHICHKVAVVKEDKLEAFKSKLSTVASVHVYSIQKAILKDSSPLYSTDYDIIKANLQNCSKFSAIYCAAALARTSAETSQVESPAPVESQPLRSASAVSAPVVNGHGSSTSSKQASQQANGIMAMFAAKPATKSQDRHREAKVEAKETPSASTATSKAPAKGNMLNNFFGKAALSTGKSSTEAKQQKEEKAVSESPPPPPLESKAFSGPPGLDKPRKKSEPAKVHLKGKKRVKRVEMSDEEEKEAENLKKKRYRIKQLESDSSDSEEVPESPVIPEVKDSSPEPEPVLKPLSDPAPMEASSGGKKRKRKRVLKSKTFVDEEGCIVTEKAYESESCTDSGEDFRSKPPTAPRAPGAHNPPVGAAKREPKEEKKGTKKAAAATSKASKQASIMGFFQKK